MKEPNTGDYIRKKRADLGMTQEDLAERVGVSTKTISNWEIGKSNIKPENTKKLAEVLGVREIDLLAGKDTDLDEDTKRQIDERINSLIETMDDVQTVILTVEDRGINTIELGFVAMGFSIVAIAMAWWAIAPHNTLMAILCLALFCFGVVYVFLGERVTKTIQKRVQADRKKKQQSSS